MSKPLFSLLIGLCLATFNLVHAQIITACNGDSIMLVLDQPHTGTITWNNSADSSTWTPIPSSDNDTFYITVSAVEQYYNASVQENMSCLVYTTPTMKVISGNWNAGLSASNINLTTIGTNTFTSSSKLGVSWTAPPSYVIDHYEITASENIESSSEIYSIPSTQNSDTLIGLKSSTLYYITIKGCANATCSDYITCNDNLASATTAQEFWQIYGQAGTNSYNSAYKIYSNSNVLSYAFPYGSWANSSLVGKLRHYGSISPALGTSGSIPAVSYSPALNNSITSVSQFDMDSLNGLSYSLWSSGNNMFKYIGQTVAVPYNNKIRLFFNATLDDNRRRMFYIDSKDGYIGKDFDASLDSICISASDFTSGGNCQYTMALGTMFDAGFTQNTGLEHVMQFKIGYPMLDNEWIWDGDSAFLISTVGLALAPNDSCTLFANKCGYASWTGSNWTYEYDGGCPKMWEGMRAPSIVHSGGSKYKLYYQLNPSYQTAFSDLVKPFKIMYSSKKRYPVFSDWEGLATAREVNYLWPNGTSLTVAEESIMDDSHFFAPVPDSPDFQVQYTNMKGTMGNNFVGIAYLLNP